MTTPASPSDAEALAIPWWHDGVIYQIYPRSFQDSDGDGIGDLRGIERRLEYLAWLGVDAIWLSPIFPSPMVDFGYDISDFTAIGPVFGSLDDFDRLVERAHARGLRVILDLVPNHTSEEHAWFRESRRGRVDPRRDWYIWRDPAPGGGPPNNWLSIFGGPAWTLDEESGQYYLHSFLPQQPDLNWRNPAVERTMHDVMRFWLDRGVDGYRVDVIHFLLKDEAFRDDPLKPATGVRDTSHGPDNPWVDYDHVHSSDQPEVHDVIKAMRRVVDAYPGRVFIGEIEYGTTIDRVCSYYGRDDELHLPLNFTLMTQPWTAPGLAAFMAAYDAAVPPGARPTYVIGNHDRSRVASRIGHDQARVAAMILLLTRNTPFMYYGDELGMADVPIADDELQDPWGIRLPGHGRDPVRTPMRWSDAPGVGFTTGVPWLPVGAGAGALSVAAQREDPASMLTLYRRLLAVRRASPALRRGTQVLVPVPAGCVGFVRELGDERWLVLLNLSAERHHVAFSGMSAGRAVLSTAPERRPGAIGDTIDLAPNEGCLVDLAPASAAGAVGEAAST